MAVWVPLRVGASEVCATASGVGVCVSLDSASAAAVDACLAGSGSASAAGGAVSVAGQLEGQDAAFVTAAVQDAAVGCSGGVASVSLAADSAATLLGEVLVLSGATTDVDLQLTAGAAETELQWNGTLVEGQVGCPASVPASVCAAVSVGCTVSREKGGSTVATEVHADLAVAGGLGLPARVSYTTEDRLLLEEGASCALTGLSASGTSALTVPGVSASLAVTGATLDVCAFASGYTGASSTAFVSVAGAVSGGASVSVLGLALSEASASVSATYTSDEAVQWAGTLSGSVTLFGAVECSASAAFNESSLGSLVANVFVTTTEIGISGSVSYVSTGCGPSNYGTVTVSVPSAGGLSATATLAQQDGCATNGSALWDVRASLTSPLSVWGVEVEDVALAMSSALAADGSSTSPQTWAGTLGGAVSLGSGVTADAAIAFDQSSGVTSFNVTASLTSAYVTGSAALSCAGGALTGSGALQLSMGEVAVSGIAATVSYNASSDTVWDVRGTVPSLDVYTFTLADAALALSATQDNTSLLTWSGSLEGTVSLSSISVAAEVLFTQDGVTYFGAHIVASYSAMSADIYGSFDSTGAMSGYGTLNLTGGGLSVTDVSATVTYDASSERVWVVRGSAASMTLYGLSVGDLSVSLAAVNATSNTSSGSESDLTWTGFISGTAALGGVSADAEVGFSEGAGVTSFGLTAMLDSSCLEGTVAMALAEDGTISGSGTVSIAFGALNVSDVTAALIYNTTTDAAWKLSGSAASVGLYGVELSDLLLLLEAVSANATEVWSGSLSGTVSVGSSLSGSADVSFAQGPGVTDFSASVTVDDDHLAGSVAVSVSEDGAVSGSGTLSFSTSTASVAGIAAAVVYNSSSDKAWDVRGSAASATVFGLSLTDLQVALSGVEGATAESGVVWSGSVGATLSLAGCGSVAVSVTVESSAFASLAGSLAVSGAGVAFDGALQVNSTSTLCQGVAAEGALRLDDSGSTFAQATVTYEACSGAVEWAVEASTDTLSLHGLDVGSVSLALDGTPSDDNTTVQWAGTLSGSVTLFGAVECSASAAFNESSLGSLVANVSVTTTEIGISGSVSYVSTGCGPSNYGTVTVSVPSAGGLSATATLAQQDGCATNGSALWDVRASLTSPLSVWGVEVEDVALAMSSALAADGSSTSPQTWAGTLGGAVSLGSGVTADAAIAFDQSSGVTSFNATVTVATDFLTGTLAASVDADGVLAGSGTLSFASGSAVVSGISASVVYNKSNADALWNITGAVGSVELYTVTLTDVSLTLQGVEVNGALEWSGVLAGTLTLSDGTTLSLSAAVVDNQFSSLMGSLAVSGGGVAFDGTVEITEDYSSTACTGVTGTGALSLTSSGAAFATAQITYDACATEVGDVKYTVAASASGDLSYDGLTLTSASMALEGAVGAEAASSVEWTGSLSATASLFGGASFVTASFSGGDLQTAALSTLFMTSNGLLSVSLDLAYTNACDTPSTGAASATVSLSGADTLVFDAAVSYDTCTGAMSLAGTLEGAWDGPDGLTYSGVVVSLNSSATSTDGTLSSRTWVGDITATVSDVSVSVSFDTSANASSYSASLAYSDDHTTMSATVGSDCTGSGVVTVSGLPYSIPSFELDVAFQAPSCEGGAGEEWVLTGVLSSLKIPFFGKTLSVTSAGVTVSSYTDGTKSVSVVGAFGDGLQLNLSFPLPLSGSSDIVLTGTATTDGTTVDSFATSWDGSTSPFTSSLGAGCSDLFDGLKGLKLSSVAFTLDLSTSEVALEADGSLYGADFALLMGVQHSDGVWSYGAAFTASGSLSPSSDMPTILSNVLSEMGAAQVRFSIANEDMSVGTTDISEGLALALFLGSSSSWVTDVESIAPADLSTQVSATSSDDSALAFEVIASITSSTEISLYIQLAGDVDISADATLKQVALAFVLSETGAPEVGFNVLLAFTLGSGTTAQTFEVDGFVGLSAVGALDVALSVDSSENWVSPFGITGVQVIFPLAVSMAISAELVPTAFAMIGSLEVGTTVGSLALGVDLTDFAQSAFSGEIDNFDFAAILTDLADCSDCLGAVGSVIADVSCEKFSGSFNPDLANAVTISIAGVSKTIAAGVAVDIENLNLWGIIKIDTASFTVDDTGITASLIADTINWGVLSITGTDGSSGPSFALAMTTKEQYLKVDGKVTVLGQSVSLSLDISDSGATGEFTLSLGSLLYIDVTLEEHGSFTKGTFDTTITATVESDIIGKIIDIATEFLYDLLEDADSALESAKSFLESAESDLDSAISSLEATRAKVDAGIESAEKDVSSVLSEANSKKSSCQHYDSECKWYDWGPCIEAGVCWVEYAALLVAYGTAEGVLETAEATYDGLTDVAEGAVYTAKGVVEAAEAVLSAAQAVVDAFASIIKAVGGALKDALKIIYLTFSTTLTEESLSVTFAVELEIVGETVKFSFTAELDFEAIVEEIGTAFKNAMSDLFGDVIPGL